MPGVGPTSAQRVLDFIVGAPDPISELTNAPVPPRAQGDEWRAFVATVGDLHAGRAGWPAELERARADGTLPRFGNPNPSGPGGVPSSIKTEFDSK